MCWLPFSSENFMWNWFKFEVWSYTCRYYMRASSALCPHFVFKCIITSLPYLSWLCELNLNLDSRVFESREIYHTIEVFYHSTRENVPKTCPSRSNYKMLKTKMNVVLLFMWYAETDLSKQGPMLILCNGPWEIWYYWG